MPTLEELYRSVIMDHARYRRNFRKIDKRDAYYVHYKNPTCGDVMTLFIDIKNEKIEDANFYRRWVRHQHGFLINHD